MAFPCPQPNQPPSAPRRCGAGGMAAQQVPVRGTWRALARALGLPTTCNVVRIPDLGDKLSLDRSRPAAARWDRQKEIHAFGLWFNQWYAGTAVQPQDVWPEWRFDSGWSGFNLEGRQCFLCVHAKLQREHLWNEVQTVLWVGDHGEMNFVPTRPVEALRCDLLSRGYVTSWFAGWGDGWDWGLRSRLAGVELHFRGRRAQNTVNVHIDLHNPGARPGAEPSGLREAMDHKLLDEVRRTQTHAWYHLMTALAYQGIRVPNIIS